VRSRADFEATFHRILEDLRTKVDASRTTLRVDIDQWGIDVDTPIAEATASGVSSIRGAALVQRSLATVQLLARDRQMLVQNDCDLADPRPPQALLDVYGVRAQMLAPLVRDNLLVGWISVHYTPSPRIWSPGDVLALETSAAEIDEVLTQIDVHTREAGSEDL
jgi:maleate isomerase